MCYFCGTYQMFNIEISPIMSFFPGHRHLDFHFFRLQSLLYIAFFMPILFMSMPILITLLSIDLTN